MGLFQWYMKEGKGVEKDEPKKRGFFLFWDIFFRKFWRLLRLNLIYVLMCIPGFVIVWILSGLVSSQFLNEGTLQLVAETVGLSAPDVNNAAFAQTVMMFDVLIRTLFAVLFMVLWGMGPATAGFTYVLRNFAREEHAWVWSDFWEHMRKNFKQAILLWILDVVLFVLLTVAIFYYGSLGGYFFILSYLLLLVAVVYSIMHFYLYPMMVTFKLSLKDLMRNAFIFALGKLPSNFLVFLLILAIHAGLLFFVLFGLGNFFVIGLLVLVLLHLLILFSFSGLIINFTVYPKLKKYMIMDDTVAVKPDVESLNDGYQEYEQEESGDMNGGEKEQP